jgi:hypothetical protein
MTHKQDGDKVSPTDEEIVKQFNMFVPDDDGSANDWLQNTLEAVRKEERKQVVEERDKWWIKQLKDGGAKEIIIDTTGILGKDK